MPTDRSAAPLAQFQGVRQRMLFTPPRLASLQRRIATSHRPQWESLRTRGSVLLDAAWLPEAAAAQGAGQHANYHDAGAQLGEIVQTLALLHAVEPDPRYLEKIRTGLNHFAQYNLWCGPSFLLRQPPWRSELVTASLTYAYALGYDLLRDGLSPADRAALAAPMIAKGIGPILEDWLLPDTRIHALDSMGHNWWIVVLSLAGIGVISLLGDDPRAPAWLEKIEAAVPEWLNYSGNILQNKVPNFDPACGYFEGPHYLGYALREYLLYRTALTDALPNFTPAGGPQLRRAHAFLFHTLYPTSEGFLVVNFGDARITIAPTTAMRLLSLHDFADPYAPWYIARTARDAAGPLALLFDTDAPIQPPTHVATSALFPDTAGILRSSWQDDATLLAVRAGTYWCHAHADSASFVLFHRGRQLISDPGHCVYSRPEYVKYYATSQAHNVVLVDGQGAPAEDFNRGSKFPGKLHTLLDQAGAAGPTGAEPTLRYVYADATGPMSHLLARHYRHWLWVGDVIVIFDDLLAHVPAWFNWLLHHDGTATADPTGASIQNGPAQATVRLHYPGQLQLRNVPAPAQDNPDAQTSYLEFSTTSPQRQQNFLAAVTLTPSSSSDPAPRVELIDAPNLLGLRIATPRFTTVVYFNLQADGRRMHLNSNAAFDGWETDAYLLAVTHANDVPIDNPAGWRQVLVVGGSYFRRNGVTILDALSKVDCLITPSPTQLRILLQGQPRVSLAYHCLTKPDEVLVNNAPHPFDYAHQAVHVSHDFTASRSA